MNFSSKLILTLSLVTILFSSCSEKQPLEELKQNTLTFNELFDKVAATDLKIADDKAVFISYQWKKEDHQIKVTEISENEIDFFVLEASAVTNKKVSTGTYSVECSNDGESWEKICDEKVSCNSLVLSCIEQSLCSSACEKEIVYLPQTRSFYLYK